MDIPEATAYVSTIIDKKVHPEWGCPIWTYNRYKKDTVGKYKHIVCNSTPHTSSDSYDDSDYSDDDSDDNSDDDFIYYDRHLFEIPLKSLIENYEYFENLYNLQKNTQSIENNVFPMNSYSPRVLQFVTFFSYHSYYECCPGELSIFNSLSLEEMINVLKLHDFFSLALRICCCMYSPLLLMISACPGCISLI